MRSTVSPSDLDTALEQVRREISSALAGTILDRLNFDLAEFLGGGKMLRARAVVRMAMSMGHPLEPAVRAAAAVEMVHGASLLHDDVIDGGWVRRSRPTLWAVHGARIAILVGDVLLGRALGVLTAAGRPAWVDALAGAVAEVCQTETEQELLLRGQTVGWEDVLRIARGKTGPLFGFAALAGSGGEGPVADAAREAGYLAGTVYQISDDWLDVGGDPQRAGKTLGTDQLREKPTTASVARISRPEVATLVDKLLERSRGVLSEWPDALRGWDAFLSLDLEPAVAANLREADAKKSVHA